MQKSDLFAYLAAFVTIVLAIALTDLVQSTHRLVRAREKVKWDILPLGVALFVYLAVLSEFFSLWGELAVQSFSFLDLVGLMVLPTIVALLAFAVLPDDVPGEGVDLTAFYLQNRRYIVVLLALLTVGDLVRTLLYPARHGYLGEREAWLYLGTINSAFTATIATMWLSANRRIQILAVAPLLATGAFGFLGWTIHVAKLE